MSCFIILLTIFRWHTPESKKKVSPEREWSVRKSPSDAWKNRSGRFRSSADGTAMMECKSLKIVKTSPSLSDKKGSMNCGVISKSRWCRNKRTVKTSRALSMLSEADVKMWRYKESISAKGVVFPRGEIPNIISNLSGGQWRCESINLITVEA